LFIVVLLRSTLLCAAALGILRPSVSAPPAWPIDHTRPIPLRTRSLSLIRRASSNLATIRRRLFCGCVSARCHICTRTGLTPTHLHREWAHRLPICTGSGLTPATSAPGLGSPLHFCTGTGPTPCTSAPGLDSPLHICTGTGLTPAPPHGDWARRQALLHQEQLLFPMGSAPGRKGSVLLLNAATWHASGAYPEVPDGPPRATLVLAFAPPFQVKTLTPPAPHVRTYSLTHALPHARDFLRTITLVAVVRIEAQRRSLRVAAYNEPWKCARSRRRGSPRCQGHHPSGFVP
jgi:hypothetical protein